jgi:exonuclease SbcC
MKINKISFTNVNSLKGSHTIDFDQRPISDAGIFAIVGPTGAGKSTILDVITLALYNKVPRFGAVSKNDIEKLGSIITYATNDASAAVTYTVKGVTYRSSWSIQKNRNNNWNDYHMELVNVTDFESIYPINKSEVPNSNAQIIGLDFNQFVKSILLSQGDFDQFLKSNAKDRAELIEKITGTTIYRTLGLKAFEKSKQYLEQIKFLQLQLDQKKLMSDEDIKAIDASKQLIENDLKKLTHEIEEGQLQEVIITKANQLINGIKENEFTLRSVKQSIVDFSSNEVKLARHESLSPYRSDISEYTWLNKEATRYNSQINQLRNQSIQLAKVKENILIEVKHLLEDKNDNTDILQHISSIDIKYSSIKINLADLLEDGTKVRQKITDLQSKTDNTDSKGIISIGDPKLALEAIDNRIQEYTKNLSKLKLVDTNINELISLEVALMDGVYKETHQRQLIENIKNKIEAYTQNEKDNLITSDDIQSLADELSIMEVLNRDKNQIIQTLKNNKGLKLDDLRNSLVVGENCPLCGSMVDDLSKLPILELGQIVLEIDIIDTELQKLTQSINLANKKMKDLNSKYLSNSALNQTIKDDVAKQGFDILSYDKMDDLISKSNEKLREQSIKLQDIREIKDVKINLDVLMIAKSLFEELSAIMQDYRSNEKIFKEKYKGIEVTSVLAKFRTSYTDINNSILQNSTLLKNISSELKTIEENLVVVTNKLSISLSSLDIESIDFAIALLLEEAEFQRLKNLKEILISKQNNLKILIHKDQSELDELKDEIAKIEIHDIEKLRQSIADKNKIKNQFLEEIGKIKQQLNTNSEAQASRILIENELINAQSNGRKWELLKAIIGDAKGSVFSSFAQNLTLNHLVRLANHRLSNFTDRYLIHTPTQDRDLEIIDTYQSNAIRAVKTLSGGETFLISLAMALSLSDLASRNINLECLFIDEGFGTLDNETLDLALDSLESLKNDSGKTIGIISHVEPLKERITTQIVLAKDGQGYSTLNVIPKLK